MKLFKQAIKFASVPLVMLSASMASGAEDAAIITAVSGGITDAGDTNKAIYMLLVGAAIVVMAAAWAFSTVRSKGKG